MEKKGFHFPQGCDLKKHSQGNFEVPMENIFAVCYGKARIIYHNLDLTGSTKIYIFMPKQ